MSSKNLNNQKFEIKFNDINIGSYAGFGFKSSGTTEHPHIDYYEITLIISGTYTHAYQGHTSTLTPGTLLIMSPYSTHKLSPESTQSSFFAICIQEDYFHAYLKQHFPDHATNALSKCIIVHLDTADFSYMEQLGRQMEVPRPPIYAADTITHLTLLNVFQKQNRLNKEGYDSVQHVLNMLNSPSYLHMTAKKIYGLVDIPPATLIKRFKERTGYTIVEYKNKKKLELAAKMLKTSNQKVIDIAYELHYDSLSYFLRVFKKEYGVTPTEYRKIHQKVIS